MTGYALEIAHNNAGCAYGAAGPVCMVLWRDMQSQDLRGFADYSKGVAAKYPHGYAALSITASKMRAPSPEVRAAIIALTREGLNTGYRGSTTVILGDGFFASVLRAALAGLSLVGGPGMPEHVSKSVDEGADYCARLLGIDATLVRVPARAFYDGARAP